jgi:hypothetical protein
MKILLSLLLLLASSAISCAPTNISALPPPQKKMRAFKSEQELTRYFRELAERHKQLKRDRKSEDDWVYAAKTTIGDFGLTGAIDESSITNTQHAGVDEGGIVKVHGNHLVILRRGRLFTVELGDSSLTPVSAVDAFGPEIDPRSAWYDELLISEDTIVVIGYSYERGGTELGFFNIDPQGQLHYRSTYHLRSNDYFSSRNYASRLIGNKLIFYTPLYMYYDDPSGSFPAVRKWHKGAKPEEFRRTVDATRVYRPEMELDVNFGSAMHTVTTCDLSNGGFDCRANVVIGPPGRVFYVSTDSVYIWASSWGWDSDREQAVLFRMPLNGSAPSALRVSGSPVDQFSFLESQDEHLNVLVRSEAKGDAMWAPEASSGDVALMRIALSSFSDGSEAVPAKSYRRLPKPTGGGFQNRFVGDYVIYGTGFDSAAPASVNAPQPVYLVDWARGEWQRLDLPHGVERIEQMGKGAVLIGSDEHDLHFTSIRLGKQPEIASRYTRPQASQGETRSHGFFYKPDDADTGMLGLPISTPARPGFRQLFETSASILFLRNDSFKFKEIGELGAQAEKAVADNCRASCVDWYGNARPIFLRGRVFALLGYELVEGKMGDGRIAELRRVNYAPR